MIQTVSVTVFMIFSLIFVCFFFILDAFIYMAEGDTSSYINRSFANWLSAVSSKGPSVSHFSTLFCFIRQFSLMSESYLHLRPHFFPLYWWLTWIFLLLLVSSLLLVAEIPCSLLWPGLALEERFAVRILFKRRLLLHLCSPRAPACPCLVNDGKRWRTKEWLEETHKRNLRKRKHDVVVCLFPRPVDAAALCGLSKKLSIQVRTARGSAVPPFSLSSL